MVVDAIKTVQINLPLESGAGTARSLAAKVVSDCLFASACSVVAANATPGMRGCADHSRCHVVRC